MFQKILVIAILLLALTVSAENKIQPLPRDFGNPTRPESALPPHLRDNATVYVLNLSKGFEVARKGTNWIILTVLVARTGDDTFRGSWPFTE